ncbi:MAG: hypothetical protein KAS32_20130 [Candidatus Peribacteraceae bacterium]|nr:hypothetical protein [Candidatus Peribacteraceae bacterium]
MTPMMKEVLIVIIPVGITVALFSLFLFAIIFERSRRSLLILLSCLFLSVLCSFHSLSNLPYYSNDDMKIEIRVDITCVKYTCDRPNVFRLAKQALKKLKTFLKENNAKRDSKGVN